MFGFIFLMSRLFILIFIGFVFFSTAPLFSQQYTESDIVEFISPSNNSNRLIDNDDRNYVYSGEISFEIPVSALKTLTVRFFPGYFKDAKLYLSTTPIDSGNLSSLVPYSFQESSTIDLTFNLNDIQTKYVLIKTLDNASVIFS